MKGTDTMRNNSKYLIILLIVLLSVGFAFLSSDSNILGMSIASKQKWSIYFNNPTKVGGNVDASQLELKDSTTIEFTVDLLKPGDFYEFTVEVINDGTIDGMINTMRSTELNSDQNKLFEYVITYEDGSSLKEKQLLIHGTSDKYKVVLRYKDDITANDLLENNQSVSIEFSVEYVQADSTSIDRIKNSFISVYNQSTVGELVQGDEVNIGDEHFYIISEDTNKYTLLAKYNLNVGSYKNPNVIEGIQDNTILGWNTINSLHYGSISFSQSFYWNVDNFDDLYSSEQYSYNILDKSKNSSSGTNYSIVYYLDNYKSYLITLGSSLIDVRLLTYEEARNDLHCNSAWCNYDSFAWFKRTTFWLSSINIKESSSILRINYSGDLVSSWYGQDDYCGVRPVIEVSKQYL